MGVVGMPPAVLTFQTKTYIKYKDYSGQERTGNYDGGYTESESPVKKIMIRNVSQFQGILDIDRRLGLDSELLISHIGSYHGERQ